MEKYSPEGLKPYISYERRMLIDLIRHTHGQPVLRVYIGDGSSNAVENYGTNHGFHGDETDNLFIKIPDGEVTTFDLSDRDYSHVVGHDEVAGYTIGELYGWRADAGSAEKLEAVTRLLTIAQQLDIVLGPVDIMAELEGVWAALTELKSTDRQEKVHLLGTIIESSLCDRLTDYIKDAVAAADSLAQIVEHELVLPYIEALKGTYPTVEEQLALLHELAKNNETLEK